MGRRAIVFWEYDVRLVLDVSIFLPFQSYLQLERRCFHVSEASIEYLLFVLAKYQLGVLGNEWEYDR